MHVFPRIPPRSIRSLPLRVSLVAFCIAASLFPLGCGQGANRGATPQGAPIVRVLILENVATVEISANDPPTLRTGSGVVSRIGLAHNAQAAIVLTASGWRVGDLPLGSGELRIEPAKEGDVRLDGHAYRGAYRLVPKSISRFDVINDVDIDGYLMGVLDKEMLTYWHPAAYRAQAIVARTYAIYVARTSSAGAGYDLFSDTRSQVYGGISAESAKSRNAVEATRGVVVAAGEPGQERIFKAYFSSCCGGITQSASAAFGDPPSEALSEQNVGTRCSASPHFSWGPVTLSKAEVTRRLRLWGTRHNLPEKSIGEVARIDILSVNRYGRPESFTVTDRSGRLYRLGCEELRVAIGTDAADGNKLLSGFCRPINDIDSITFAEGHGLGHGVGLCQWCAEAEATAGIPHEQIVLQAYPRSVLVRAY
ncbi:MAG TPA: SpoIID/LytB domain-containing protein [Tepidisphaeraceae bacterium]|nr:SpoIID/LytB domain-containing protein [Tepidisphaeraceae bacterium]